MLNMPVTYRESYGQRAQTLDTPSGEQHTRSVAHKNMRHRTREDDLRTRLAIALFQIGESSQQVQLAESIFSSSPRR